MRGSCLVPVLLCAAQALTFAAMRSACAEDSAAISSPQPILPAIRAQLADPDVRKAADAGDLAALQAFYKEASGPVWTTDMGFSTKGQRALFEIEKADAWGLDDKAFDLPAAGALPDGLDDQAAAEIKLDLAILKYARFARGGRTEPTAVGKVYQTPQLRDPSTVLAEIAGADAPDAYLRSLQPRHAQFARLRKALRAARGDGADGKLTTDAKRIIMNMERWRWMPEDLGHVYVWSNTPAFMLYVVKDGETIYADKTQVGTIGYATPVLSADMTTVVFNPEWIAPPTVLKQNLAPALRRKNYAVLKKYAFSVSRNGTRIDPTKVDWRRVNIMDYTFTQRPGPHSNVGKMKFLLPNKHAFVLHDTWPERYKYYKQSKRAVGHDCVRMEKPDDFAKVILAESNGWPADKVQDLWEHSVNDRVALDTEIPVYSTYFTAVADEDGKVTTYPDLYGLDHKLAAVLFGTADGFPMPAREVKRQRTSKAVRWKAPESEVTGALQGFASD